MRIGTPGLKGSDQIMQRFVAKQLGIPETDAQLEKTPEMKKEAAIVVAGILCPECGSRMDRSGNMERCACGYAQATASATKVAEKKRASDTSVAEYYKKIYPDDYVSELTGKPDSSKVTEYGHVPIDKPVGDVGMKTSLRVRGEDEAGKCEVKDSDPTPPEESPCGSANEAGECKDMGGESANSVGGPGDIPGSEKPNGKAQEAGQVEVADAGLPSAAKSSRRRVAVGAACAKCGSSLDQSGQCPTCGATSTPQVQGRRMLTREQIAIICPSCAQEMQRLGVKAISANWLASQIAGRARVIRKESKVGK